MKYNPLLTYSSDRANSNEVMMAAMVAVDLAALVSVRFVKSLDMISLYVITNLSLFMFKKLSRLHLLPLVHICSMVFSPRGRNVTPCISLVHSFIHLHNSLLQLCLHQPFMLFHSLCYHHIKLHLMPRLCCHHIIL